MIKLSKLTDYAVVVLTEMARQTPVVVTVPQLAERTGVPSPTVAKILKTMVPAGLMTSQRGAAGGYRLSRAAEEISIAEIITALDGPIALTACVHGVETVCGVESLCPMRGNWEMVNQAVRNALEAVSLADMMAPAWPLHGVDSGHGVVDKTTQVLEPGRAGSMRLG
ncbi:MAG: SUF system Fe-S cluster assembly regulator [Azospirillum sp.]|nr:SUF system Fe-S cluster assembly regulator [Azospirillum sp.]